MSAALRQRGEVDPTERAFVELLAQGVPMYEAAARVGIERGSAWNLAMKPSVLSAMDQLVRYNLQKGSVIASSVISDAASGITICSPTRLDAAKTLLDRTGYNTPIARPAPRFADADLSELSAEELRALVTGSLGVLADRAKPVDAPQRSTLDDKLLSLLD